MRHQSRNSLTEGSSVTPGLTLVRRLADGGMGCLWIADHAALGIQVAVKFIATDLRRREPALLERFAREARTAARIKDPHIVQVLDYGITGDGVPFIVMELLDGESLEERLERCGPLSANEAHLVVGQVAGALAKAHSLGVVHRDIKPANLFLTDAAGEPFVKILDFGVAKLWSRDSAALTATHAVFGTACYMSPEQIRCTRDVDAHADMWALAVTAYQLLTGQLPFEGETAAAVAHAVLAGAFVPPSAHRPSLPAALDGWFERALALDPARRFASAFEYTEAFVRSMQSPSSVDRPLYRDTDRLSTARTPRTDELSSLSADSTRRLEQPRKWWPWLALLVAAMAALLLHGAPSEHSARYASATNVAAERARLSTPVPRLAPEAQPSALSSVTQLPEPRKPARRVGGSATKTRPCARPFYVDEQGIKRVRRECL